MHVARHPVPPEVVARRCQSTSLAVRKTLERVVAGDVDEISMLESTALGDAQATVVRDPASSHSAAMLHLAARAGGAMWMLADSGGAPIDVVLQEGPAIHLAGEIDDSHLTGYRWLVSFWLATLAREHRARELLLATSIALEGPRRHTQAFELPFIAAIREHMRGSDPSASIAAALDKARPGASQLDEDWLQMIDRPRIALAGRVFARDRAGADAALLDALEGHRRYWERPSKANHDEGWLAVSLAALMVMARDAGLALETTSDYAPESLLAPGAFA